MSDDQPTQCILHPECHDGCAAVVLLLVLHDELCVVLDVLLDGSMHEDGCGGLEMYGQQSDVYKYMWRILDGSIMRKRRCVSDQSIVSSVDRQYSIEYG